MPRVPGVPTLDPVNLPLESPGEAGKPGQALAQLGAEANDVALTGLDFDLYLKKAQEHVDSLAAQNQLAKVYADTQNQLSKTQNSRDVADVIQQSNKTLNDVSSQWSKSPASIQIQMSADALRPDLSRMGTVKQVDLMSKEFKITIDQQGEVLGANYAADRAAGGNGDMALGAFSTAVAGGVSTGLVGSVQAEDMVRKFRQKGQELQIRNGITNANPEVNQRTYDQITNDPKAFPDVTQEQLDTLKGQALSAFEAHTKMKDWAEGQMALQTQLVPKIQQFTNPATGNFDEGGALKDNADRLAKGEITETQSKVLASALESHQAQLQVGMKAEAGKRLDAIDKELSGPNPNFAKAEQDLEVNRPWFENNGFSDDYRAAIRYTQQAQREVRAERASERAEGRYEHMFAREEAQEHSEDQFANVAHFISDGGLLTKSDLYNMSGAGKGKMQTAYVDKAWKMMQAYESQPDFKSALDYIDGSFKIPKTATADQAGAMNKKYSDTIEAFQQQVNANPTKSKLEIAHDLVKSSNEELIKSHADAMFGASAPSSGFGAAIKNFFAGPAFSAPTKTDTPPRPKGVPDNYEWNPQGNNGKGSWRAPSQ